MDLKLVPLSEYSKSSTEFYLVDAKNYEKAPTTVKISWDGKYGANQEIPFEFTFFNENRELVKDVKYAYFVFDEFDNEIASNVGDDNSSLGITSSEGIDVQRIFVPSQGQIRIDVKVLGTGLEYNPKYAGIGSALIEIGPSSSESTMPSVPDKAAIPAWIKNNAEWWAAGEIDDNSFIQGIQYLIKKDVLKIPPTTQGSISNSNEIPTWIKNNAEWWAAGEIDDNSFIQGIQFLIKEGIMRIQS